MLKLNGDCFITLEEYIFSNNKNYLEVVSQKKVFLKKYENFDDLFIEDNYKPNYFNNKKSS